MIIEANFNEKKRCRQKRCRQKLEGSPQGDPLKDNCYEGLPPEEIKQIETLVKALVLELWSRRQS